MYYRHINKVHKRKKIEELLYITDNVNTAIKNKINDEKKLLYLCARINILRTFKRVQLLNF